MVRVQWVPLQGIGKGIMWLTNRGDDGHMLVGIKPWNHMGYGYMGACLFVILLAPFSFFVMATITTIGAHTPHAQPNFVSASHSLADGY